MAGKALLGIGAGPGTQGFSKGRVVEPLGGRHRAVSIGHPVGAAQMIVDRVAFNAIFDPYQGLAAHREVVGGLVLGDVLLRDQRARRIIDRVDRIAAHHLLYPFEVAVVGVGAAPVSAPVLKVRKEGADKIGRC